MFIISESKLFKCAEINISAQSYRQYHGYTEYGVKRICATLREESTNSEMEKSFRKNQIPDPDAAGVPRRRFALGSGVGLGARFELLESPFDLSHTLCVF
jgi:hypothetical protein